MGRYEYEVLRPESGLSVVDVSRVRSGNGELFFASELFGRSNFSYNSEVMGRSYARSDTLEPVTFRPARTDESLTVAAALQEFVKWRILDRLYHLQIGRIARTDEGVYVNVRGGEDEAVLKKYLVGAQEAGGIRIHPESRVAFVPYGSFEGGLQDVGTFVSGGLARGLEMTTRGEADHLSVLASRARCSEVKVWGFDESKQGDVLHRVVILNTLFNSNVMGVCGRWPYDSGYGFAFGMVDDSKADE